MICEIFSEVTFLKSVLLWKMFFFCESALPETNDLCPLENGPRAPKRNSSSNHSNHPCSGAFAVSFREGNIPGKKNHPDRQIFPSVASQHDPTRSPRMSGAEVRNGEEGKCLDSPAFSSLR